MKHDITVERGEVVWRMSATDAYELHHLLEANKGHGWMVDAAQMWLAAEQAFHEAGEVIPQHDEEPYIATFRCPTDGFTLSFPSCRYSDRYCAWDWLQDGLHGDPFRG